MGQNNSSLLESRDDPEYPMFIWSKLTISEKIEKLMEPNPSKASLWLQSLSDPSIGTALNDLRFIYKFYKCEIPLMGESYSALEERRKDPLNISTKYINNRYLKSSTLRVTLPFKNLQYQAVYYYVFFSSDLYWPLYVNVHSQRLGTMFNYQITPSDAQKLARGISKFNPKDILFVAAVKASSTHTSHEDYIFTEAPLGDMQGNPDEYQCYIMQKNTIPISHFKQWCLSFNDRDIRDELL